MDNIEDAEQKQVTPKKNKRNRIKIVIVLIAIIIFALHSYINYRAGKLEAIEAGEKYLNAFNKNMKYLSIISVINFIIVFLSVYITNKIIKSGLKKFFYEEKKDMPKLANKSIAFIVAIFVSIITSNWYLETTITALNATQFGVTDPIFNLDVSFYIFLKPFIEMIIYYFIALMIGLTIYIVAYHIIVFNSQFESIDRKLLEKSIFFKQLLSNAMLIIIGIAVLITVRTQGVVSNNFITLKNDAETVLTGAGLTEKIITVWGYRIFAVVMIVAVFFAIRSFKKKNSKKIIFNLLSIPAYLVVMFVVMMGYKIIYVNQNELDKQKEYISKNMEFTKTAYNLNIEETEIDDTGTLSFDEINKYEEIINNIPIVTSDIVLSTITQTQGKTGYYIYNKTKPIIYDEEMVYISAREISNKSRTYNNKTYEYTHGYGAIITSASKVDENGNLRYLSKEFDNENISQPRIYYGLETNDTVVTKNGSKEFDYPISSTRNAEYEYDGTGGLKSGFIDRLVLALDKKDLKLAFVNSNSSILINRNIVKRAKIVMPYLLYDEEPYIVVTDSGELVWVLDAYTTSNSYPYAQSSTIEFSNGIKQTINYVRNSVKVLINAYSGEISFYITDRADPIVMAYNNMYPELFKDSADIPQDISKQFVYSKLLYNIQSNMLKMYHNVSTDVLYRGDDIWDNAIYSTSTTTTAGVSMDPYYTMLKTKDSEEGIFGLVLPYTLYGKQNIISYLIGTANGADSKLVLYKFSQDNNILGPLQLNNLLSQDEKISSQITSLSVIGTRLTKSMVIVPIDNTLLYVVPIYQTQLNESQSTPILKKIVVASGSKLAIGNNVAEALENLLSTQNSVEIEVENTDTIEELINAIIKANNNLYDSSNITNWEQMGKDITKLQDLIRQLERLQKEEKEKNEIKDEIIDEETELNNEIELRD